MRVNGAEPGVAAAQLATLGRLTRGTLHELANPLLALLGNAEFALEDVAPGTKLHERISAVQRMGLEIAEIVRALQGYVRQQNAPATAISLAASAEAAVALVRRVSADPEIELSVRLEAEPVVEAPPGSVLRSLVELLLDGIAGAERGGELVLVVSEENGEAVISLAGTGELRLGAVTP